MINLNPMATTDSIVNMLCEESKRQTESILLQQLGELVTKGLLVIEKTELVLIKNPHNNTIELKQAIRLVLKDKEYIDRLEKENKELKQKLETLELCFRG